MNAVQLPSGRVVQIPDGWKVYPHAFGARSLAQLRGVMPGLVDVAALAIQLCEYDGTVLAGGGLRTTEQAQEYAAKGTGVLNSRHLKQPDGFGHAIDLVAITPGKGVDWKNLPAFRAMANAVKRAAALLEIPIRQGCDWNMNGKFGEPGTKEYDWPHFEDPDVRFQGKAEAELQRYRAELSLSNDAAPDTVRESDVIARLDRIERLLGNIADTQEQMCQAVLQLNDNVQRHLDSHSHDAGRPRIVAGGS